MKKLLIAASALTVALFTIPNVSLAAPGKSAYCDMAKSQRNPVSWNAHYHCLGTAPKAISVTERAPAHHARNPYCDMAKAQRNPVAWNAFYHCL
jgi:hypothetical protein